MYLFNSTSSIMMFVVFALLVVLMIGIAVFGSIKERNKRIIEHSSRKTQNLSIKEFYVASIFKLEMAIEELEYDMKTFKPSVGKKTMRQISDDALDVINDIKSDANFSELKKSEKYGPILIEILNDLAKNKPTNWLKTSFSSLNIVKAKTNAYKTKSKDLYEKIQKDGK